MQALAAILALSAAQKTYLKQGANTLAQVMMGGLIGVTGYRAATVVGGVVTEPAINMHTVGREFLMHRDQPQNAALMIGGIAATAWVAANSGFVATFEDQINLIIANAPGTVTVPLILAGLYFYTDLVFRDSQWRTGYDFSITGWDHAQSFEEGNAP